MRGMVSAHPEGRGGIASPPVTAGGRVLDAESAHWLHSLASEGVEYQRACDRLHGLLLRIARSDAYRRGPRYHASGPELDDIAHQAAADALLAITRKLDQFRGESRFTTWAFKFVVFEVSSKLSRHSRTARNVPLDAEDWQALPDRFGIDPHQQAEARDLLTGLRRAVDSVLTDHQRHIFVALMLNGIPLDALVAELGTNRNAVYKTMFDARRKLRARLVADGFLDPGTGRDS